MPSRGNIEYVSTLDSTTRPLQSFNPGLDFVVFRTSVTTSSKSWSPETMTWYSSVVPTASTPCADTTGCVTSGSACCGASLTHTHVYNHVFFINATESISHAGVLCVSWQTLCVGDRCALQLDNLELDGEEINGLARCPFDSKQTNVALFAGRGQKPSRPLTHDKNKQTGLIITPASLTRENGACSANNSTIKPYKKKEQQQSVVIVFQRGSCILQL